MKSKTVIKVIAKQKHIDSKNTQKYSIYFFKINNKNSRTMWNLFKLITKTSGLHQLGRPGVFIVNLEQISRIVVLFISSVGLNK